MGSARLRFLTLNIQLNFESECRDGKKPYLGDSDGAAAAASAAALAKPCNASIGALREALGKVSSDSSSEDGA